MNISPAEREKILADYAESCRLRFIKIAGRWNASGAINHPQQWNRTCRESTIRDIHAGHDTWERIAKVAERHRASASSDWSVAFEPTEGVEKRR